jgi:DNA polymerase III subunit delta
MVALKSPQTQSFLKSIDPKIDAILVFGGDPGLVSELASLAAKTLAEKSKPVGEILRIEDSELENDPDRLIVELRTVQMFGGPKVVRTTASRRITAASLAPLLDGGLTGKLIVEAGALKADDALRGMFEKSDHAAAIACYADTARDLDTMVSEILRPLKLDITTAARQLLVARLGADRALSRGEVEKLALYASGQPRIDVEDVEAIVGDAAEQTTDRIIAATAAGNGGLAVAECDRAIAAGENAQVLIAAIQRYFHRLHRVKSAVESGRSFDDATRTLRPPLFFKQKDEFAAHCRVWTADRLVNARGRIARAAHAARLNSPPSPMQRKPNPGETPGKTSGADGAPRGCVLATAEFNSHEASTCPHLPPTSSPSAMPSSTSSPNATTPS